MNECPKFDNCNSAFCPAEMSGLHLRDESICNYFRMIAKDKSKDIPKDILLAILENQMIFLANEYKGYMSQYKKLIKTLKTTPRNPEKGGPRTTTRFTKGNARTPLKTSSHPT